MDYPDRWVLVSESSQFKADLDEQRKKLDLRTAALAQFRKVGPQTLAEYEAAEKKAAKEVEKATLAAVAAYERRQKGPSDLTLALQANTVELAGNRAEINKVKEGLGSVGNALGLIDPRLQVIASGFQKVTGVAGAAAAAGEVVGASLTTVAAIAGPLVAVVGGVGLAWHIYSERAKEAQEAQDRLSASLDEINPIAARARDEIDKLKLNLGQYTQAEYDENEIRKEFARSLENTTAKWEEERIAVEENMAAIGTANAEYLTQQDRLHELNDLIERSTTLSEQGQEAALVNLEFTRETAEADRVAAERTKERTAATKDATAAERDLAEQRAASQAAASAYASAMLVFTGAENDYEASLSKTDAALVKRDETLAKLADSYQKAVEAASALGDMEGLAAADEAYQRARVAAEAQANAEIEALHDSLYDGLLKTAQDGAQKEAAARQIVQDALLGQASAAASAIESAAGAESAAGKAAAITQIILGEIALLSKAAAYGPAAPAYIALGQIPLALAAAKLAGLGKADATVTDSPRVMQAGPNGANIRVAPGDQVAAARTRRDLQAQVGGGGGGSAQVTVALQVAGRTTQRITATARQTTRRAGRHKPAGTKGRG